MALAMVSVLGVSMISAYGFGNGFMNGDFSDEDRETMQQEREAMHDAIVNGNYDSWAGIMQTRIGRMQNEITPENFNSVVERYDEMSQVHELREQLKEALEESDNGTAEELRIQLQELMPEGTGQGFGIHSERGMKMHSGNQLQSRDHSCLD